MKKTNILKITLTLMIAFAVSGVFAQNTPDNTSLTITDVTNYVELIQAGNADLSGSGLEHSHIQTSPMQV